MEMMTSRPHAARQPRRRRFLSALLCACLCGPVVALPGHPQERPALGTGYGLAETIEAIERARVVTRVLYIDAHPDDESGAVLAWLARGAHADVALLSLTRGEGGQNALGPEQAPQLGLLRTEELLAACRYYGVKLYFGGAQDFGFSKSPQEAIKVWGEPVLANMVQVIREFRPHIIVNNWGGVTSGHGHHQAAGLLTPKAVEAAADPRQFPDAGKIGGIATAWRAAYVIEYSRGTPRDGREATPDPKSFEIPLNDFSPLWGMPYSEIGVEGYAQHRTQGVQQIRQSTFFRRLRRMVTVTGENFEVKKFSLPLRGLGQQMRNWRATSAFSPNSFAFELDSAFHQANGAIDLAREAINKGDFGKAARDLAAAGLAIANAQSQAKGGPEEFTNQMMWEADTVRARIDAALRLVAGARLEARADRSEITPGSTFTVQVNSASRDGVAVAWGAPQLDLPPGWSITKSEQSPEGTTQFTVSVPASAAPDTAFHMNLTPWPSPPAVLKLPGKLAGYSFAIGEPVVAQRLTTTRVETLPLVLVPAVTLANDPPQFVIAAGQPTKPLEVVVRVHHYGISPTEVEVGVDSSVGWKVSPPEQLKFGGPGDQLVKFTVTPPAMVAPGEYPFGPWARVGNKLYNTSLEPLPTLPTRLWSEPALVAVHAFHVNVPEALLVGYVAAENDPIPAALRQIGARVELLDENALAFGDLQKYDAIAVGIRAYELRQDLVRANRRLLDYAAAGGTLVVQYQREGVWDSVKPAPYPAVMNPPRNDDSTPFRSSPRVTIENAPVRILAPEHPLLNVPNKISNIDFAGWVQERGLSSWTKFDAKYTPLLGMNDPGEPESNGSLVVAQHGKGLYIYTGLSLFRQIPAGVPGGYRLMVNLLSACKVAGCRK